MVTYIALLRGVNVGGNVVKMERLREIFSELGFKDARTYVQSGNVVFAAEGSPSSWSGTIERSLAGEIRLPVSVIVRTAAQMKRIVANNPFLKQKTIDRSKLHVTFLGGAAPREALRKLSAVDCGDDQFRSSAKEIYLYCPNGYARTKLANNRLEKLLSVRATTRNWNTVGRLCEMAAD